jgi:methionyl-tRNA formyltransferase
VTLRVLFFGTPQFAVPTLDAIVASRHEVVGVVTQPDRPRGRGQRVVAAAVKARALEHGLPVLQPDRLKGDQLEAFAALGADIGVVAAYGKILPQRLLDVPPLGMVNVHASLLPRWRGAAPVHRAVMAGDDRTGVTIMRVVRALDAGPILLCQATPIGPDETSAALENRLAAIGAGLLTVVLDRIVDDGLDEVAQEAALVTYAARIERSETNVEWARPARAVHDHIRGVQPWPLASAMLQGRRVLLLGSAVDEPAGGPDGAGASAEPGTIIRVEPDALVVATAPGAVRILHVQSEGKSPMPVRAFLNGRRVAAGERLSRVPLAGGE